MKNKLSTLAVVLLACFTVLNFSLSSQALNQSKNLERVIKENPDKIVYVQAKDGKTPIKGIDYFDGASGINAMSFSVTNNIVKEVPLIGEKGEPGADGVDGVNGIDGINAPTQELRINPETGDLESKYSNWWFWTPLIPCSELKVGCPDGQ